MSLRKILRKKAEEVVGACMMIHSVTEVEVIDRGRAMWDDDGSGNYFMCVGSFHEYEIVSVERRRIFGLRWLRYKKRTVLLSFGGHEFFGDGRLREPWCAVHDERLAEVARQMIGTLGDGWDPVILTVIPHVSPP